MKAVSTMRLRPPMAMASMVVLRLPGKTELADLPPLDMMRRPVLCGRVCAWALLITVSLTFSRFTVFRSRSRAWGQMLPPSVCGLHELFGCLQQSRLSRLFFGAVKGEWHAKVEADFSANIGDNCSQDRAGNDAYMFRPVAIWVPFCISRMLALQLCQAANEVFKFALLHAQDKLASRQARGRFVPC